MLPNQIFRQWKVSCIGLQDILNRRVIPSGVIADGSSFAAAVQYVAGNYLDGRFSAMVQPGGISSTLWYIEVRGSAAERWWATCALTGKTVMRALQDLAKAWSKYSQAGG